MEYIILWILALFGLWNLITRIIESYYIENRTGDVEVTIKVKNHEHNIEWLIRQIERIDLIGKINIEDDGSDDATLEIIHKLEKNHPQIRIKEEQKWKS